jgi:glycosyltransferase involved in cell wall biosynthesis
MRIIQLSAGTGSFYCGTCLRDNALVVELRRQGHDALLVPLYLPLALDETPANDAPLFYGGVNVYLQQKSDFFRKTPRWLDRVLDAPPLLTAAAKRAGMTSARDLGAITLSMLRGEEGSQVKELDRLTAWLAEDAQPDVVCLSNALLIGLARRIKERTGAAVACFLNGEHAFLDGLPEPERQDAWNTLAERAAEIDAFLPVSRYYAGLMGERACLPAGRVHIVYPGILLEGYDAPADGGRRTEDGRPAMHQGADVPSSSVLRPPSSVPPPTLGFLAKMCPEKGLETLVEAFLRLRDRGRIENLKLRVAGACTAADEPYVERLRQRLAGAGLAGEVEFLPNLDRNEKIAFLRSLSALSVPANYGEAFGLYVIEALAAGVPVVQPRHGAFPELIAATGGGLLCDPDDPASLAAALEELLADPTAARAMAERGRQAVFERFSVSRMAGETLRVLEQAIDHQSESNSNSTSSSSSSSSIPEYLNT